MNNRMLFIDLLAHESAGVITPAQQVVLDNMRYDRMNPNLKILVEEAKQGAREYMSHSLRPELFSTAIFQKKLIELIVRECASLAYEGPGGILEHFGVKE